MNDSLLFLFWCVSSMKRKYCFFHIIKLKALRMFDLRDVSLCCLVASIMFCVAVLPSALRFIRQISALYE